MAEEVTNDLSKAVLILNVHDIEQLDSISSPIITAAKRVRNRLLVVIFHPSFDEPSGTRSWPLVQKLLTHAYVQASKIAQLHNKILMRVDVILQGVQKGITTELPIDDDWEMLFYTGDITAHIPKAWSSLPSVSLPTLTPLGTSSVERHHVFDVTSWSFPVVIIGGTFDHLHAGHKILLSMAAWITERKIIVGVTDDSILVKKTHREILESIQKRIDGVHEFLRLFKPGLEYEIVPIHDVYGPTAWDPDIQALVVSKETLPGAASVASIRAEKCLPPLQTFVIDVISAVSSDLGTDDPETLKNGKMSSTFIREWIYNNCSAN